MKKFILIIILLFGVPHLIFSQHFVGTSEDHSIITLNSEENCTYQIDMNDAGPQIIANIGFYVNIILQFNKNGICVFESSIFKSNEGIDINGVRGLCQSEYEVKKVISSDIGYIDCYQYGSVKGVGIILGSYKYKSVYLILWAKEEWPELIEQIHLIKSRFEE